MSDDPDPALDPGLDPGLDPALDPDRAIGPARDPASVEGAATPCPGCGKPGPLCVCAAIDPVRVPIRLLVLQHPQERAEDLGTAGLLAAQVTGTRVAVGLSWRNLGAALGTPTDAGAWGALHLGPAKLPTGDGPVAALEGPSGRLLGFDRSGRPLGDADTAFAGLSGLVLLDGTWSQAKTLWWRNPWLLKCRRLVLIPRARSRYGTLRREPRRESLSTIEAAALALALLTRDPSLEARVTAPFVALLRRVRAETEKGGETEREQAVEPSSRPHTRPAPDRRRLSRRRRGPGSPHGA